MSRTPVRVRPASGDDVEAVAELERVTLGPDAWSPGLVAEGVRGALPTITYLLAEQVSGAGWEAVGHAVASRAGEVLELQRIGVAPDHRRTGVATALLAAVLDLARTDGSERVLLEVREDNAGALALYAGAGFVELARRARYYADGTTAVVLQLLTPPAGPAAPR